MVSVIYMHSFFNHFFIYVRACMLNCSIVVTAPSVDTNWSPAFSAYATGQVSRFLGLLRLVSRFLGFNWRFPYFVASTALHLNLLGL